MKRRTQEELDFLMSKIQINIDEAYEVSHWAKHFKVTESHLRIAISKVGPLVADVRQHLRSAAQKD